MPKSVGANDLRSDRRKLAGGGVIWHGLSSIIQITPGSMPSFEEMFSFASLLRSWQEFVVGKRGKVDVADFASNVIHNLSVLHDDLMRGRYHHGGYTYFRVSDPKPRDIHKASVRDRVVHHAIYRALYPYFDRYFISDSYSCRVEKGTHRALRKLAICVRREGRNNTHTVWALSCDIKKCFASVSHIILKELLRQQIECPMILAVIDSVIDSFSSGIHGKGIPLGNLTSQLFINIYLDTLDQHVKRVLGARLYLRYADDFVFISRDKGWLMELVERVAVFLDERLDCQLHPNKVSIKTIASGVDFLGWVHFPDHRVLRTVTKRRMHARLSRKYSHATQASYLGMLSHGNAKILQHGILAKENHRW